MELKLSESEILDLARFGLKQAVEIATGNTTLTVDTLHIIGAAPSKDDNSALMAWRRGGIPAIGEYWEGQGGIRVVPDLPEEGGRVYDLIAVTGPDKKTPLFFKDREWGGYGREIKGADSKRNGIANTDALVIADNVLAKDIRAVVTPDGQTDCYWLAQTELMGCYVYAPQLFGADAYWSSSQFAAHYAWVQDFDGGYVNRWYKSDSIEAFPVRRVYK